MKAVMISVRPCWCEQITAGVKSMEVRRKCPKLAPPFYVLYIPDQRTVGI